MRKSALALLIAAASVAAILATSADAKERHYHALPHQALPYQAVPTQAIPREQFNQMGLPGSAISPPNDPTGVYLNGRLIGRDPDPAVRLQIEQYYGRGAAS